MANQQQQFRQHDKHPGQGAGAQSTKPETGGLVEKAREAASAMGQHASDASSAVASGMQSLGGAIRERGPREGMWGTASAQVASTLESGGRYLKEEGFGGLVDEVAAAVRKNPLPAVLIGIGLGFLIARTTSRS